ncbi:MAG: hypothetical protein EB015_15315 [Methylocystaceae bacterium]|nr:hypothetical protein [Methylocystaceae bacterium]
MVDSGHCRSCRGELYPRGANRSRCATRTGL